MRSGKYFFPVLIVLALLALVSCAPNNERFIEHPAGFWAGLWHGLIAVITFIISLFTDKVAMYQVANNGAWYDLGFLIGAMISLGQCGIGRRAGAHKKRKSDKEKEWEDIAVKVEEKVRKGIREWVEETSDSDGDWEEIGRKVEEKIKRELQKWADS